MTRQLTGRHRSRRPYALITYGSLIVVAELSIRLVSVDVGIGAHAGLLLAITSQFAFSRLPKNPILPVLALLSAIRLISIVLAPVEMPPVAHYALLGLPTLGVVLLLIRALPVSADDVGLRPRLSPSWQVFVPITGVPFGWLLRISAGESARIELDLPPIISLAAVTIFVVVLEELLFRGLLQSLSARRSGQAVSVVLVNVLYGAMYLNSGPAVGGGVMALSGVVFSWFVLRTGALYASIGAHVVLRFIVQA